MGVVVAWVAAYESQLVEVQGPSAAWVALEVEVLAQLVEALGDETAAATASSSDSSDDISVQAERGPPLPVRPRPRPRPRPPRARPGLAGFKLPVLDALALAVADRVPSLLAPPLLTRA